VIILAAITPFFLHRCLPAQSELRSYWLGAHTILVLDHGQENEKAILLDWAGHDLRISFCVFLPVRISREQIKQSKIHKKKKR
jgi:hypothetical protein